MKSLRNLSLLFVGCIVLSGCAPSAATAFSINSQVVSEKQVDLATDGCAKAFNVSAQEIRADIVKNLVIGKLGESIVKDSKFTITEGERRTFLQANAQGRTMLKDPECTKVADGIAFYLLGLDRLGPQVFSEGVTAAKIVVNPRYGSWDKQEGSLSGSGSMSNLDPTHR